MKKLLSIIIMTTMILTIGGCGSDKKEQNISPSTSNQTEQSKEAENTKDLEEQNNSQSTSNEQSNTKDSKVSTNENRVVEQEATANKSNSKNSIVYFSRVGNTNFSNKVDVVSSASLNAGSNGLVGNAEIIANIIKEETKGDVFEIKTVDTYPEGYRDTTDQASKEKSAKARPKLASHVDNIDNYDVIFLVYPNWWGTIPMSVYSFLEEYNLSGKTIIPCCTHEGSGLGSSERDIASVVPKAKMLDGLAIRGGDVNSAGTKKSITDLIKKSGISVE